MKRRLLLFLGWSWSTAWAVPVEIARIEGANIQRPVWAPDGTQLAWEANHQENHTIDLYMGDAATRQFQRLGARRAQSSSSVAGFQTVSLGYTSSDLSFSPAALARVIYTASNAQHDLDLYVEGVGPVAVSPGADGGATWAPSGRYVAFTSSRTGEGDLYLLNTSDWGAPPRRLTSNERGAEVYADWAPDSTALVYVSRGRQGDNIWRISVDGVAAQLTGWPGSQIHPRYGPVDRWIAFYANPIKKERFDLYIMVDDPASAPILLAEDVLPNHTGPAWTPDGQHILFTVRDDESFNPISIVAVDSPMQAQTLPLDTLGHGDLAVSPVGSPLRIAYVAQGRSLERNLSYKRLYLAEIAGM